MESILPNFLIVGAAKSGTTSLFHYLKQHPDIFLPEFKEPHFFVSALVKNKVYSWIEEKQEYENLFAGASAYNWRGEASVTYLYYYKVAVPNILDMLGRATKIIIILRNPVERALSAYNYTYKNNPSENNSSFEKALELEQSRIEQNRVSPMLHYKTMGLYYDAVMAYKDNFDSVLVLDYKDLVIDPSALMCKIFAFLEVKFVDLDFKKIHNKGGDLWRSQALKNFSKGNTGNYIKMLIPDMLKRKIKTKLFKKVENRLTNALRGSLNAYYKEDIAKLKAVEPQFGYWELK